MTLHAVDLETELARERAHLDISRAALTRMRERAEHLFATGDQVSGDPFSAESLGRTLSRRVAELADNPSAPLFFGRLDFGGSDAEHANQRYYVGRRHVTDDAGEPLVLDWRAPVSRSFYRASAGDPQGVAVRRRFGWAVRTGDDGAPEGVLTSFEDEHLDRGEELGTASRILTAEIERPRVGPMRDIVATIQPEQDELVRADLAESICVQGAPGTGKTAVGLHRAAYLLYLHRERLKRAGVLIVGPNRAFLHYIAAVLPALGELDVTQTTIDDLVARVPVRAVDSPAAAAVKQDARMARVLANALHARIARPTEPIMVPDGSYRWRISVDALRRIVDDVRREAPAYGVGRERVRARVVALLVRQAEYTSGESPGEAWQRRMGRAKPVTAFLDAVWPAVTPEQLVVDVLSDPDDELLTEAERDAVRWATPPKTPKSARWTAADTVLIDEAAGLIERVPSFGHVVIDEAQDLSPMQCRVIARRSEHGSITLLGDLAQGTAPWAARAWRETLAHLGKPDARVVGLRTGFRVPQVVVDLANRLLPALDVDVPGAVSLRRDGTLRIQQVPDLAAATVEAVRTAGGFDGSVGVIAADAAVPGLVTALTAAGVTVGGPDDDERVTVMPATLAKGLEYDHVIVVEPAAIVAAEPRGLHRLYVVLTRAVSRLDVLHHAPLPAAVTTPDGRKVS
ncbi:HelD family protein [Planosporangium sp. 12N6]|uniref:HelD family protein n=1 Tax=Planosporangium spinosum TaxID=3402278 RepID=UPI003CFA472E